MVKTEIKGKVEFPSEIVSQKDLLDIARSIFLPLLTAGIDNQIPVTGGSFPPLEAYTINKKGHSKALIDTRRLRRSFKAAKVGKYSVRIDLASDRAEIGKKLQIDGVPSKHGVKHFNFFGITDGMEKNAMEYIRGKVNGVIKKFNGR